MEQTPFHSHQQNGQVLIRRDAEIRTISGRPPDPPKAPGRPEHLFVHEEDRQWNGSLH
jgi:hypothetical protein